MKNDMKRIAITKTRTGWAWVCVECSADEIVRGPTKWAKCVCEERSREHACGLLARAPMPPVPSFEDLDEVVAAFRVYDHSSA